MPVLVSKFHYLNLKFYRLKQPQDQPKPTDFFCHLIVSRRNSDHFINSLRNYFIKIRPLRVVLGPTRRPVAFGSRKCGALRARFWLQAVRALSARLIECPESKKQRAEILFS